MYKEDFEGERSDREKAHRMMDEIRSKHQEETVKMEDQIRRLQKELHTAQEEVDTHKYSHELAEKTFQRKDHEVPAALAAIEKAKEETKTKSLQVTQYKKQVDQLRDQVKLIVVLVISPKVLQDYTLGCMYIVLQVALLTIFSLQLRLLRSFDNQCT